MNEPCLSLIVAVTENGVIGRDNDMPWHLPSDLQKFKRITWGKPVIMGRKTYQSIGKPLPGRTNIVVTRSLDGVGTTDGILVAHSLAQALHLAAHQAAQDGVDEIFCIGGAEIFKQALARADRLYMTEILASIEGDTFFPTLDLENWHSVVCETPQQGEKDTYPTRFVIYQAKAEKT